MRPIVDEQGQAAVELVALLPLLAALAALVWQTAVAGQAMWLTGTAARAAARAHAVGGDSAAAVARTLPSGLERGARVRTRDDGSVSVSVRVPSIVGRWQLGTVTARALFARQRP